VVAHGVRHGAVGDLAGAYLRLRHRMDLRKVELGFPTASEIPDDVDVR
jgi:hypothetical protein